MDDTTLSALKAQIDFKIVHLVQPSNRRVSHHIMLLKPYCGRGVSRLTGELLCSEKRTPDSWADSAPGNFPTCSYCVNRAQRLLGPAKCRKPRGIFGLDNPRQIYPYKKQVER